MGMGERAPAGVPWWLFLVTGVAWLLIAMVVLRFNLSSVSTVGVLLGIILLLAGVNEFVAMGTRPGWKWLYVLMGVLFIGGGIWALVNPIGAFYELAAILGFLLVLKGAFDISLAFMVEGRERSVVAQPCRGDPRDPPRILGVPAVLPASRRADPAVGRVRGPVPRGRRDLHGLLGP